MYTKKKYIIVYIKRRKNARQDGLCRALRARNNVLAQSLKTRYGANVAKSGQREKSLSAQFPVGLFAFCAVRKSKSVGVGERFFQIGDFHVDVTPFDVVFWIEVFA